MQMQVFNVIREKDLDTWDQWHNMWYMPNSIHLNRGSLSVFLKIWRWHFCMEPKMKSCSNLHWRMKMWRIQTSGLLKNEDYKLPNLVVKMKIAFLNLLKIEDLKTSNKNVKKMKTMSCMCRKPLISRRIICDGQWWQGLSSLWTRVNNS